MQLSPEFLETIVRSATFWRETVAPGVIALVLGGALIAVLAVRSRRFERARLRRLHQDRRGAAAAVDFILTIPIVLSVVFIIVQFALLAHASLIVHYAAFASARSARVFYWDYDTAFIDGITDQIGIDPALVKNQFAARLLANNDLAVEKAEFAASYALISVSPGFYPFQAAGSRRNGDRNSRASIERLLREVSDQSNDRTKLPWQFSPVNRVPVMRRKASYAFSSRNTKIDINPVYPNPSNIDSIVDVVDQGTQFAELFSTGVAWPVQADVEFRYYMAIPLASRLFGEWQSEGFYARTLQAQVKLL